MFYIFLVIILLLWVCYTTGQYVQYDICYNECYAICMLCYMLYVCNMYAVCCMLYVHVSICMLFVCYLYAVLNCVLLYYGVYYTHTVVCCTMLCKKDERSKVRGQRSLEECIIV